MKYLLRKFIPRIKIRYKSKTTKGYPCYKYLELPRRPFLYFRRDFYNEIDNILTKGKNVIDQDELGILISHDLVTNDEDIICAVGVGNGISLIHNCLKDKPEKSFIGIEASSKQIKNTIKNAKLNNICENKYYLINGFGGTNSSYIYGDKKQISDDFIDINQLKFDVLELDCEGAELHILKNLTLKPKHIIVETHPSLVSIDYEEFLKLMRTKGYSLNLAYTVFGQKVMQEDIPSYFTNERIELLNQGISWGENLLVLTFSLQKK